MPDSFWSDKYPGNGAPEIDPDQYNNLMEIFESALKKHADRPAYSGSGITLTYADLDRYSSDFASFLQHETNMREGDRLALQMPNLVQYPVCILGAMKAGLVVVNTNPLYTEDEMLHQFNDANVRGLVVLENICEKVEQVLPSTRIETVIITRLYDMDNALRRVFRNTASRYGKSVVPNYDIPLSIPFTRVLSVGSKHPPIISKSAPEDLAVLQYTGGTTGVAKGAELTHRNLVANMLQLQASMGDTLEEGQETMIAPLPLYHIYSFTLCCMAMMHIGAHVVLIAHPRDLEAFVEEMSEQPFTLFVGLATLFRGLCEQPEFAELDFSKLKLTVSGGMPLHPEIAALWEMVTGCEVSEGYGLTEASPVVTVNPPEAIKTGTVGLPLAGTELKLVNAEGQDIPPGSEESGELLLRGPQVMRGYWKRDDETAQVLDADGWLRTGDVAVIQPDGYVRIVDRMKDMMIISGFNVYPNEIEDVLATHPDVIECAAIGVADKKSGEAIKVFVVSQKDDLSFEELESFCRKSLTGYKVPKQFERVDELPRSEVGKVLRRVLRKQDATSA